MSIYYKKGYKYQLTNAYTYGTSIIGCDIFTPFLELHTNGNLDIQVGYAWDGPSGPTIDTRSFMRASLVHDALYQLMREELLNIRHRQYADELLKRVCLADGMGKFRAWYVYWSVRMFGKPSASSENRKEILTAP